MGAGYIGTPGLLGTTSYGFGLGSIFPAGAGGVCMTLQAICFQLSSILGLIFSDNKSY